jgi:glycosyltransferase involved in cell wall biosynthesis
MGSPLPLATHVVINRGFRLKILHVVPTYLPAVRYGGPVVSVHGLCKALAARGHDVHVFTTNIDGLDVSPVVLGKPIGIDGVMVWYFATGLGRRLYRSPSMGAALQGHLTSFDIAHIHSVFLWPTTAAARAARDKGVPYLLCPRGMLVRDLICRKSRFLKSTWIALFEKANVEGAAAVHLTSKLEAEEFGRLGLVARRIEVAPNGIDIPPRPPPEPIESGDRIRPRVLSLGRISWKKGLDRLIQAMVHVPDAELVVAGNDDEDYGPRLERLAAEFGVAERTRFFGEVRGAQKWELIRSCDVFVMASYSENFGIAALEAMACGKAVVATPEVGLARTIEETGAGLVVRGDPVVLGETLAALLANRPRLEALGRTGAEVAVTTFSWEKIAERVERIYDECIEPG